MKKPANIISKNPAAFFLLFFFSMQVSSQNLVLNPSFEDTLQCPNFVSQIDYAVNWHTSVNTPDYYHVCNNTSSINPGMVGVPWSARGYQPARTGNAFGGVVIYWTAQPNYREIFYAQLQSPLVAGVTYSVGMYTILNEDNAMWAVDGGLGIYLSASPINPATPFAYTPQIVNPTGNVLNDSLNWTMISGTYLASGGEQYITIGSFIPDNMLTIFNRGGTYPFTSYAIEDVWVIPEDSIPTGVSNSEENFEVDIFPNPVRNKLAIGPDVSGAIHSIELFTAIGRRVLQMEQIFRNDEQIIIDVSSLDSGIYFLKVGTDRKTLTKKIVIM